MRSTQPNCTRNNKSHNTCAVTEFLSATISGEFSFRNSAVFNDIFISKHDCYSESYTCTALQVMDLFKDFIRRSGLATNVDSVKSLGWALKKYPDMIEKIDGRLVRYIITTKGYASTSPCHPDNVALLDTNATC